MENRITPKIIISANWFIIRELWKLHWESQNSDKIKKFRYDNSEINYTDSSGNMKKKKLHGIFQIRLETLRSALRGEQGSDYDAKKLTAVSGISTSIFNGDECLLHIGEHLDDFIKNQECRQNGNLISEYRGVVSRLSNFVRENQGRLSRTRKFIQTLDNTYEIDNELYEIIGLLKALEYKKLLTADKSMLRELKKTLIAEYEKVNSALYHKEHK